MEGIVDRKIEQYLLSLRPQPDGVRGDMERLASERAFPIVGPEVGRTLALLARASGARRILELGSGFGYSAWWFAGAIPSEGTVVCTDVSAENRDLALDFLGKAGFAAKVRFVVGDALDILETLKGSFDLIFNDIDKEDYPRSVARVVPRLNPGGLFVTDNTLWYGKVAEPSARDATTRAVREFNRLTVGHPELDTVILPIRDGLSICRKR